MVKLILITCIQPFFSTDDTIQNTWIWKTTDGPSANSVDIYFNTNNFANNDYESQYVPIWKIFRLPSCSDCILKTIIYTAGISEEILKKHTIFGLADKLMGSKRKLNLARSSTFQSKSKEPPLVGLSKYERKSTAIKKRQKKKKKRKIKT